MPPRQSGLTLEQYRANGEIGAHTLDSIEKRANAHFDHVSLKTTSDSITPRRSPPGGQEFEEHTREDAPHEGSCWIRTAGPSEAIVKTGACMDSAVEIVVGDSVVVYPWCQMISMLDLSVMTLSIQSPRSQKHQVYTKDGVPLRVTSVAQVNIGPPPNEGGTPHERERILRTAAEMFGGLRRSECQGMGFGEFYHRGGKM